MDGRVDLEATDGSWPVAQPQRTNGNARKLTGGRRGHGPQASFHQPPTDHRLHSLSSIQGCLKPDPPSPTVNRTTLDGHTHSRQSIRPNGKNRALGLAGESRGRGPRGRQRGPKNTDGARMELTAALQRLRQAGHSCDTPASVQPWFRASQFAPVLSQFSPIEAQLAPACSRPSPLSPPQRWHWLGPIGTEANASAAETPLVGCSRDLTRGPLTASQAFQVTRPAKIAVIALRLRAAPFPSALAPSLRPLPD